MQQERAKGKLGNIATAVATNFQNCSIQKTVCLEGDENKSKILKSLQK